MKTQVVFSRIFFGDYELGQLLKCEDKRYKRGFVCGKLKSISGFSDDKRNGTRTLVLDSYFESSIYKRESSVIKILNEKEYLKEWITKRRDYLESRGNWV